MSDIVERLFREAAGPVKLNDEWVLNEAAGEIKRLRQDNAEMRELLNTLAEGRARLREENADMRAEILERKP